MTETCGLTVKKPESAPSSTLVIEYGTEFFFLRGYAFYAVVWLYN